MKESGGLRPRLAGIGAGRARFGAGLAGIVIAAIVLVPATLPAQPAPAADEASPRRVYVPIEDLDVVFEHDRQGVVLPREEYEKLKAAAQKNLDETPASAHKVVVSRARYAARVEGEQLVLDVEFEFTQLGRGWQTVTLPFRNLAVESARLDDQPARLGRGPGEGRPIVLFTRQPGKHSARLELSTPLVSVGSDKVAGIGLAPIPAATLEIELPPQKFLHVDEVALERPAPADQPARYTLAVGGKIDVSLRITDRRSAQESATLVFASTSIGLHVAPEERTWRAVTSLSVYGKPVDRVVLTVPKTLDVVSVESTGLERWEIGPGDTPGTTALTLVYRQPFNETRTVTIAGVSASVIGQPWSVPTLSVKGATSHLVRVLVQHPAGLRLQQVEATAARRIAAEEAAASEMPGTPDMTVRVSAAQMLYYAAWREDFALVFVTQPRARELQASVTTRVDVDARELTLRSSIALQSRFAALFDFDVAVPVDWTVSEVLSGGQPADWRVVPIDAAQNRVRVSFHPPVPADGKAAISLVARRVPSETGPVEEQPVHIRLPEVSLPQVSVTDGRYLIAAEDDLDVVVEELAGLDPARLLETEARAARPPRLAYEYQDTRLEGVLKVSRKPLRLASQIVAFHRLDRETLASHLEARVVASGGGVQRLRLALPESAGTNLRFRLLEISEGPKTTLPQITEQTAAPPADGARVWTLQFDQRAFGLLWIVVDLQSARSADVKEYAPPALRVLGADRESAQIAIEAGPDQQLTIAARDDGGAALAEIDPADVAPPAGYLPRERIVAAWQAARPGYSITLSETRFDRGAVPTALCDRAALASVVGDTGELQHKAEFAIRAVGVQSLRIELPAEGDLWATLVDGQPMEVRVAASGRDGLPAWLVPLPPAGRPDAPRILRLLYSTQRPALGAQGVLRQTAPRLAVVTGSGDIQPIEILERDWTVYHSPATEITSSTGEFEPTTKPERVSLLGMLQRSLRLGSPSRLLTKAAGVLLAVAGIWVVTMAYRRRGMGGLAGVAAVSLIALVAFVVFLPASRKELDLPALRGMPGHEYGLAKSDASAPGARSVGLAEPGEDGEDMEIARQQRVPSDDFRSLRSDAKSDDRPVRRRRSGRSLFPEAAPRDLTNYNKYPRYGAIVGLDPTGEFTNSLDDVPDAGMNKSNALGGMPADSPREEELDRAAGPSFGQPLPPFGKEAGGLFGQAPGVPLANDRPAPGKSAPPRGPKGVEAGGLLSLAIDLQAPRERRTTQFRYSGSPVAGADPILEIQYQNRDALSFASLAWQAGVLLLFWIARRWSAGVRAGLGVLGLVGPLALVPVVPLELLPTLDGIFLGTVWGLILWIVIAVVRRGVGNSRSAWRTAARLVPFIALAALSPANLQAQTAANEPARAAAPPQAAPGAPAAETVIVKPRGPTIVIPYDPAQDPLQSARVFLPFDQFLELWNAAHPEKAVEPGTAEDGVVAAALYAAKLSSPAAGKKPSVEVAARYVLHNFRDEQITLPLPIGPVAFDSARLDGQAAPLVPRDAEAGAGPAVVVATRGAHVLDAHFGIPAELTGPAGKFTLPLQPVAAGALRFSLPASDLALRVNGASGAYRLVKEGDQAVAIIPIDRGGNLAVSWAPVQSREAVQGIVHAEGTAAVQFDDGGLRMNVSYKLTVRQGTLSDVSFSLPDGLLVRQISGLDLGGWELAGDGAQRSLKVFLRRAVADATALQFDLYQAQAFGEQTVPVALPPFAPLNLTRETGTIGIFAGPQLSVAAGAVSGLAQIDAAQFQSPPPMAKVGTEAPAPAAPAAPQFAYRYAARPFQLQLLVTRQKPATKAVAEHAAFLGERKLRLASRYELQLGGAPRSEIAVQLPPGYLLYDLKSNDAADYFVESPPAGGGPNQGPLLHVELAAPKTGAVALVLDGVVPRAPEDLAPRLSVPVPLGVSELRTSVALWLERDYSATLDEHTGWKSVDPAELPERIRSGQNQPPQFAFVSTLTGLQPIGLTLRRATPRLAADSLAVVLARDTSVQYLLYLRWGISLAGENTFVFTTPDWLADRLDFDRGARIRQVLTEKIAGNRLRWTVTLEEPRQSVLTLVAQATLGPPTDARIASPSVAFEQRGLEDDGLQIRPLENQRHYLLLVNQSQQRLDRDVDRSVEAIAADDLPIRLGHEISDQAAEILRLPGDARPIVWKVLPTAALESLPASVNLARLTLVIARDGSWRGEAYYRVNNRTRQFLGLRMPAGSRVLSLYVAGEPSRPIDPRRAGDPDVILVPLPKTAAGDLSAEVRLISAGRLNRPLPKGVQVLRTELDLPAPQVLSQLEDRDFGMPVASTEWTVYLPEEIDAQPVDDRDRTNVVESAAGVAELIADYTEWLNLYAVARDKNLGDRAQSRAKSNLKQMGIAVHVYDSTAGIVTAGQRGKEVQELSEKVAAAQKQLAAEERDAATKAAANASGKKASLDDLQQGLLAQNPDDFRADTKGEADEQIEKTFERLTEVDRKAAEAKPGADKSKAEESRVNRLELKKQTAAQSMEVNAPAEPPGIIVRGPEAGEQGQPGKGQAQQQVDADEILEELQQQADGVRDFVRGGGRRAVWPGEKSLNPNQLGMFQRGAIGAAPGGGPEAGAGAAAWLHAGGLSLEIELPQTGQKLTFSKSGGDPKLALALRPRASLETGFGVVWTVVWLLVAVSLIAALGRPDAWPTLGRRLPWLLAGAGLLWFFLLPAAASGFALFLVGAAAIAWQRRRAPN